MKEKAQENVPYFLPGKKQEKDEEDNLLEKVWILGFFADDKSMSRSTKETLLDY